MRHVAVAIPIVAIGGLVALGAGQQRPQPQQTDFTNNQPVVGWRGRQPLDRGLGFVAYGQASGRRLQLARRPGVGRVCQNGTSMKPFVVLASSWLDTWYLSDGTGGLVPNGTRGLVSALAMGASAIAAPIAAAASHGARCT